MQITIKRSLLLGLFSVVLIWLVACAAPYVESFPECVGKDAPGQVCYVVSIVPDPVNPRIAVKMQFQSEYKVTALMLKKTEQRTFELDHFMALSKGAGLAEGQDYPYSVLVSHPSYRWVQVSYEIRPLEGSGFSNQEMTLTPDILIAEGWEFLMFPEMRKSGLDVRFVFQFPAHWEVRSSLGEEQRLFQRSLSKSDLWDQLIVAGDIQVEHFDMGQARLDTIFYGEHFNREDGNALARVLKAERQLFGDQRQQYYLAALASQPTSQGQRASGSARQNSFRLFVSGDCDAGECGFLDNEIALHVAAHEMFHFWNGGVLKSRLETKWFWEGVTDYYAELILLRLGLIDLNAYAETWNRSVLVPYYLEPELFRKLDTSRLAPGIATDVSYPLGTLMALNWDTDIKQRSQMRFSLDDVMRSLFQEAAQNNDSLPLTQETIVHHVGRYLDEKQASDNIQQWAGGGVLVPLRLEEGLLAKGGFGVNSQCFSLARQTLEFGGGETVVGNFLKPNWRSDRACKQWFGLYGSVE